MAYTGTSIVDYLKSVGQPSDLTSRIALGKQYGIDYTKSTTNYATENTQLLNVLRSPAPAPLLPPPPVAPLPAPTPPTPPPSPLVPFAPLIEPFKPLIQPSIPTPAPAPAPAPAPSPAPIAPAVPAAQPAQPATTAPATGITYYNVSGAYFQKTADGKISAVGDPNTLSQLKSGALATTPGNPYSTVLTGTQAPAEAGVPDAAPQVRPSAQAGAQPQVSAQTYTGPSIVDYLSSIGQLNDYASRAILAREKGIVNYTGTAEQNTQLLNALRGQQSIPAAQPVSTGGVAPIGGVVPSVAPPDIFTQTKDFLSQTYGINVGNIGMAFSDPVSSIKTIIKDVMVSLGLPDVKTQIEAVGKEKKELEDAQAEEIMKVDENPWLSEGLRIRKTAAIKTKYESRINNKINELKLYQDMYDDARQEAQFAANLGVNMYQDQRDFLQGQLEFIINAAEKAADNARLERVSTTTGTAKATITGTTGATYSARLNQEVNHVYAGRYGKTFAREQAIRILKAEFPKRDVAKDIYARIPDGYEANIKSSSQGLDFGDL